MEDVLCETCLERGRERQAEIVTENLQMCRDCFNGKPTCREETVGGSDAVRARADVNYKAKHRAELLKKRREWRRKNRARVNAYQRRWLQEHREPAQE